MIHWERTSPWDNRYPSSEKVEIPNWTNSKYSPIQYYFEGSSLKDEKIKLIAFTAAFLLTMIIVFGYIFFIDRVGRTDENEDLIIPGEGMKDIKIGDTTQEVLEQYGEPEDVVMNNYTIWWSYRSETGLDFLFSNITGLIIEIRFNEGYRGKLEGGIGLGSGLEEVLSHHNGAMTIISVSYVLPEPGEREKNRVLYNVLGEEDLVQYRVFYDDNMGIMYWFNMGDIVTQIVVY